MLSVELGTEEYSALFVNVRMYFLAGWVWAGYPLGVLRPPSGESTRGPVPFGRRLQSRATQSGDCIHPKKECKGQSPPARTRDLSRDCKNQSKGGVGGEARLQAQAPAMLHYYLSHS
jgi:hypothetical protein